MGIACFSSIRKTSASAASAITRTRYIIGGWAQQMWGASFPYETFIINLSGCFIPGMFATLAFRFTWSEPRRSFLALGSGIIPKIGLSALIRP